MYLYMYVCTYVCMYIGSMYVCMYVCMCVCIYACMFVCMYVHTNVCMLYACTYIRTYVCVYACTVPDKRNLCDSCNNNDRITTRLWASSWIAYSRVRAWAQMILRVSEWQSECLSCRSAHGWSPVIGGSHLRKLSALSNVFNSNLFNVSKTLWKTENCSSLLYIKCN